MQKQLKGTLSLTILIFLLLTLFVNGYFQKDFFIEKWNLPDYIANVLLVVENGAKVLLELAIAIILINGIGHSRYIAISPFILAVVFLVVFGVFQSFSTRTFYTQTESQELKIADYNDKDKRNRELKEKLETRLSELRNSKDLDTQIQAKTKEQTLKFIEKLDPRKDRWLINKNLAMLNKNGKGLEQSPEVRQEIDNILKKLEILDREITPVSAKKFTYNMALNNAFDGKISTWDVISDLFPAVAMEFLIILFTGFLSFYWKGEISEIVKKENEEKTTEEDSEPIQLDNLEHSPQNVHRISMYRNDLLDNNKDGSQSVNSVPKGFQLNNRMNDISERLNSIEFADKEESENRDQYVTHAEKLRQIRKNLDTTQHGLARLLSEEMQEDVSRSRVARWENNLEVIPDKIFKILEPKVADRA